MAQYWEDWSGYTEGDDPTVDGPAGWTKQWDAGSGWETFAIVANANAPAGKALRMWRSTTGRAAVTLNAVDADSGRGDIEIAALVNQVAISTSTTRSTGGLCAMVTGTGTSETGIVANGTYGDLTRAYKVYEYLNAATATTHEISGDADLQLGQRYWFILNRRSSDGHCRFRVFDESMTVQSCDTGYVDAAPGISTLGGAGLFNFSDTSDFDVLAIGVGTGGDAAPTSGTITLSVSSDFPTGNVTTFSGDTAAISFVPQLTDSRDHTGATQFSDKWASFGAKFVGLNGAQPTFTVNYSAQWNTVGGLIRPVFAYDPDGPWTAFSSYARSGGAHVFSHSSAFSQSTVYVCSSEPWNAGQVATWVTGTVAASQYAAHWPSDSDTDWVLLTQSGGTTDWGKVVPDKPVYGFRLTDADNTPPGGKRVALLISGQHAFESSGNYALKGFVDWLLAGSADALSLLEKFEFWVVPLVNPVGRDSGTARSQLENIAILRLDPNRDWNVTPSKTALIGGLKSIIAADIGAHINVFMDFHGYGETVRQVKFYGTEGATTTKCDEWVTAFHARHSTNTLSALQSSIATQMSESWVNTSISVEGLFSPVELCISPETTLDWPVSDILAMGQHYGGALLDRYTAGDYAEPPEFASLSNPTASVTGQTTATVGCTLTLN